MFGSVILDVAIGLVLVYLLFSLVSASIREWLAAMLKTRATTLEKGLLELLGDARLVADLYDHPLVNSLYRGQSYADAKANRDLPSYIPARSFSTALLDMIVRGRDTGSLLQSGSESRAVTAESVRAQISRIDNPRVQRAVLAALDAAGGDLAVAQANIEQWFDSTMDRVSGWYKSRTQVYVFAIGLAIVVIADADSLAIARRLYTDPVARAQAVALAGSATAGDTTAQQAARTLEALDLPLVGWRDVVLDESLPFGAKARAYLRHASTAFVGWLITAFAISLGAPFWFDTLGRIMVVRNTVKPGPKSAQEGTDPPPVSRVELSRASNASTPSAPATAATAAPALPPPDYAPQEWADGHPQGGVL